MAAVGTALGGCGVGARPTDSLRPPGALPEESFASSCIRCGRCGVVCPVIAIRFIDTLGPDGGTPYIVPTERACILCMKCTAACPTGALVPLAAEREVQARVTMGTARIGMNRCWAYRERDICRACWYACPFPDLAIRLDEMLRPSVDPEHCVGCGLCAEACPTEAGAMMVRPA